MEDDTTQAAPAAPPPAKPNEETPVAHIVERPLGEEFPLTDHESIAAKFKAEVKDIAYAIETDIEAGVHKLKGWLKF